MSVTIPDDYFCFFESIGQRRFFPENTVIYYENDDADDIYLITKGRVRAYLNSSEGKDINLEVLKKGRLFGDASFLNHSVCKANIITVTETELIQCQITDLIPILQQNADLMLLIMQHFISTCQYLTHTIKRLVSYNSVQKVVDFLLIESEQKKKSIPYTHEDIANCLNMNRVTVSRIMKDLKNRQFIDYDYGIVSIKKPSDLKKML